MKKIILKREQVSVMFHPAVLAKIDIERNKKLWNRSRFIEEATLEYIKNDKANG